MDAHIQIGVAVDNDIQIFLNGADITNQGTVAPGTSVSYDGSQFLIHDGCASQDSYVITLPVTSFHQGTLPNVIAIRARRSGRGVIPGRACVFGDAVHSASRVAVIGGS